jgi:uncharacterized protein (TIRG00374 family)
MSKKQILVPGIIAALLTALVYYQVRTWKKFDWVVFREQTSSLNWWLIAAAVLAIFLADALRGVRWTIFLKPVKPVPAISLVVPQFIGFAGLALLGRPGELIRPYLIARRVNLGFSSQIAVWTVERIFDVAAVVALLTGDIVLSHSLRTFPAFPKIWKGGVVLVGCVIVGILFAFFLRQKGAAVAHWLHEKLETRFPAFGRKLRTKIEAFSEGLNTIHDMHSLGVLSLLSLVIWMLIAGSYRLVTLAYHGPIHQLGFSEVILLMFFSVAGGIIQLPVVGGGSQLATIGVLQSQSMFGFPPELATSCGILLWLVTFMSVAPLGVVLARHEHLSLAKLAAEEQREAHTAEVAGDRH